MIKKGLSIIIFSTFLSIACAEEPKPALINKDKTEIPQPPSPDGSRKIQRMASVYQGRSLSGLPCTLLISNEKEAHGNEPESSMILAKLEYIVDGLTPMDVVVDFYRYNPNTNKYFDRDSGEPGAKLILLSILLKDESTIDPNKLLDYEARGLLVQSLRIEFQDNKKDIEKIVIKIEHSSAGHYDTRACMYFQLKDTREAEFDLKI